MGTRLSNLEIKRLFEAWGFVPDGGNGGHLKMSLNGKIVQITAPNRHTNTPPRAISKAAKALNISYNEFLAGPTAAPKAQESFETFEKFVVDVAEAPDAKSEDLCAEFRLPKTKSKKIMAVFERFPNMELTLDTVANLTGLPRDNISVYVNNAGRTYENFERVSWGKYMLRVAKEEVVEEEEKGEEPEIENMDYSLIHTLIHTDPYGRRILLDDDNHVWIAIKAEPGYISFK